MKKAGHPRLILIATILASSLSFIDGSVVNVGLAAIARSFNADATSLQWVINAYTLPLSALLLLGGAVGDRFGQSRIFILGIVLFALASIGCALAPGLPYLLAARGLQGIGAALLMPNSLAILSNAFTGEARGRAIGIWAATGAIMGAGGPVLGGYMIDTLGWRSIFFLNLPLAAASIALALVALRDSTPRTNTRLDWPGACLVSSGLGAMTWGLTIGAGRAGFSPVAIIALIAGIALLALFLLAEKTRGDRAMMPLSLFASRAFVGLTMLTLLIYGALGGLMVLLPYVLIQADHYASFNAGASLLPMPLIVAAVSPFMGGVAGKYGARLPLVIGSLIMSGGFCLMLRIGVDTSYWLSVLPAMAVTAFGLSILVAPLTTAVMGAVDATHTGAASGVNNAVARTGGLLATALLGGVLAARGETLIAAFHDAALVGVAVAFMAALSAAFLIGKKSK